jgi:hypothetical protein
VADAGRGLGGEQVSGGGLEELQHRGVLEGRRVRHVDDHDLHDALLSRDGGGLGGSTP